MNRSIQTKPSPANRQQMDFIRTILGKYGMTRWRSRFQNLILRQYPLLFTEPQAVETADTVINNIHSVKQTHIHHSFYYPVRQVMTVQGTVSRMLRITQGSSGAGTGHPPPLPGNGDGVKGGERSTAGSPNLIQVLQERVRKQQSNENPVTTAYRALDLLVNAVEPVSAQASEGNPERSAAPPWSYLPPLPSAAARRREPAERRSGSGHEPHSGDSRQLESITGKVPRQLPAALHELQTLRTYSLYQSAGTVTIDQQLREEPEPEMTGYGRSEAPVLVLKSTREAVPGSAGTTVEAQQSTPSIIFRSQPGPGSRTSHGLHLNLGQQLAAALEKLESRHELLSPLPAEPAAVHRNLQQHSARSLLPLAVLSEPQLMVQRNDSAPFSRAAWPVHPGGQLSVAPQPVGFFPAMGPALPPAPQRRRPGGMLSAAGPGQEEHLQPGGSYRSLILRKPEAAKAVRQEPVQQRQEPVFQEQASRLPSQTFSKTAAPAATMDTAELNQLAERVYQVLEKKMAIRKDRRGLR